MVVSEIIERLSPNMAPPTTAPMQISKEMDVAEHKDMAIGAIAAIVPIPDPIATPIKEDTKNTPGKKNDGGIKSRGKYTAASVAPTDWVTDVKAPASKTRNTSLRYLDFPPL